MLFFKIFDYFTDQTLEISRDVSSYVDKKLLSVSNQFELKYIALFRKCVTSVSSATDVNKEVEPQKTIDCGILIITTEAIHLTTDFQWLCESISSRANDLSHIVKIQPMTDLVELKILTKKSFAFTFMNELQSTVEKWELSFDSHVRIIKLLEITDEIWRKIFCLPLISEEQLIIFS